MTRTAPIQVAFSSGEIDPLLHRRADYQRNQTGMATARGFLPLRQGGFTRMPGTFFRGRTRNNAFARVIPFEFARNDAVVLELAPGTLRVWRYGAPVLSGTVPYELAHPYDDAALRRLVVVQSADVIYLADGVLPMRKLSRFALDNWTLSLFQPSDGPFRAGNLNEALTVTPSAATGTITLTAASSLFVAAHVGSLMSLEPVSMFTVPIWTGNTAVVAGDRMTYDGRVYEVVAGPTNTGVNPPVHREGDRRAQKDGIVWRYLTDELGIVRITAVNSPTSATAVVLRRLHPDVVASGTYRWAEGAWSDRYGYPAALEIHEQRLFAAATRTDPRTLWASGIGAFESFRPGIEADDAFAYTIAGGSSVNRIVWLQSGRRGLHIGALGEEHSTRSDSQAQAIGPTTAVFGLDSAIGSSDVRPIAPAGNPIFVAKDGQRLFEIAYSFQDDANRVLELSLPSQHLGAAGFSELAWQSAPQRLLWVRRGNGEPAVMLYDPAEEVLGWAQAPIADGTVLSLCATPTEDGAADRIAMVVSRVIDGTPQVFIEEAAVNDGILTGARPVSDACHLFASASFIASPAASTFTVTHLAGAEVHAWTDRGNFGPLTVAADGTVTLPEAVTRATIGLFDATHEAETLDIPKAAPDGSALGRLARLDGKTVIGLHRTAGGTVQAVELAIDRAPVVSAARPLLPERPGQTRPDAVSGLVRIPTPTGHAAELRLRFRPEGGAPMTITAVRPAVTEAGA
jgi:hypothetical protein